MSEAGGADNVNTPSPDPRPRTRLSSTPSSSSAPPSDMEGASRFAVGASAAEVKPEKKEEKRGLFGGLFGGGKREKDKREPSSVDGGASSSSPANLDAGEEEDRLVRTSMHATHGAI